MEQGPGPKSIPNSEYFHKLCNLVRPNDQMFTFWRTSHLKNTISECKILCNNSVLISRYASIQFISEYVFDPFPQKNYSVAQLRAQPSFCMMSSYFIMILPCWTPTSPCLTKTCVTSLHLPMTFSCFIAKCRLNKEKKDLLLEVVLRWGPYWTTQTVLNRKG